MSIFLDGDFPSNIGVCKHHCSPTCHPAQVGPEWRYGCLHPAWPSNREHEFCPIVECNGDVSKCEVVKQKCWMHYKRGLFVQLCNARKKVELLEKEWEGTKDYEVGIASDR